MVKFLWWPQRKEGESKWSVWSPSDFSLISSDFPKWTNLSFTWVCFTKFSLIEVMFINPKIGVNPEIIPVFQPMFIPSNTQGYVKI